MIKCFLFENFKSFKKAELGDAMIDDFLVLE